MPGDFTIDARSLKLLRLSLGKSEKVYNRGIKKVLTGIGSYIQGVARSYAPESPTIKQYAAMNQDGVTLRSRSGITTGSLRDSITSDVGKDSISIGVPTNSRGGKYAEKMHDGKGKTWHNRGPNTVRKGPKAGDKYITRAYEDSKGRVDELIDDVLDGLLRKI